MDKAGVVVPGAQEWMQERIRISEEMGLRSEGVRADLAGVGGRRRDGTKQQDR